MEARCERDGWVFTAKPKPYPTQGRQTTLYDVDGDQVIDCPCCHRGYFRHNGGSDVLELGLPNDKRWHSDRPLTILPTGAGNALVVVPAFGDYAMESEAIVPLRQRPHQQGG
jgi:hypothetical protein